MIPAENTLVTYFNTTDGPGDRAIENLSVSADRVVTLNLKSILKSADDTVESITLNSCNEELPFGISLQFPEACITVFFGVVKQGFALSQSDDGVCVLVQSTASFPGDGKIWENIGCTVFYDGNFCLLRFKSSFSFSQIFSPLSLFQGRLPVNIAASKPVLVVKDISPGVINHLNEAIPGTGESFSGIISSLKQFQLNPSQANCLEFQASFLNLGNHLLNPLGRKFLTSSLVTCVDEPASKRPKSSVYAKRAKRASGTVEGKHSKGRKPKKQLKEDGEDEGEESSSNTSDEEIEGADVLHTKRGRQRRR